MRTLDPLATAANPSPTQKAISRLNSLEERLPDILMLSALLLTLLVFYLGTSWPMTILGGVGFSLLAFIRPDLALVFVAFVIPFFFHPKIFNLPWRHGDTKVLSFSPAECVIIVTTTAYILRSLADNLKLIPEPWRFRQNKVEAEGAESAQKSFQDFKLDQIIKAFVADKWSWPVYFIILTGAASVIATRYNGFPHPSEALREYRTAIVEPAVFYWLGLRLLRRQTLWYFMAVFIATGALVGRVGLGQFLFGQDAWGMEGVRRVISVYPGATALGIYLGRIMALSMALALCSLPIWRRGIYFLLLLPITAGVLLSYTRGAWVGVAVTLAFLTLFTLRRDLAFLLGGLVVVGSGALVYLSRHSDRVTSNASNESRLQIWRGALGMIKAHPLFGIGPDQFLYLAYSYNVPRWLLFTVSHPHNMVLDFMVTLGFPGLIFLLGSLYLFFREGFSLIWPLAGNYWQNRLNQKRGLPQDKGQTLGLSKNEMILALALISAMIELLTHGMVDSAFFVMDEALSFWVIFLGIAILVRLKRETS